MNPLTMKGSWGPLFVRAYNRVVAPALLELYARELEAELGAELARPGTCLLDVGCGRGDALALLASRFPLGRGIGVDLSPTMVAAARRRHRGQVHLDFRQGDAQALPLADGAADVAMTLASIKHWQDPARGLAELARVLRPGGRLHLMEAAAGAKPDSARALIRRWRWRLPFVEELLTAYFCRFVAGQGLSAARLEQLLRGAGFGEIEIVVRRDLPVIVGRASKPA